MILQYCSEKGAWITNGEKGTRRGVRMLVELLDDKKLWDQFVENSPQGLLFHKWDFLKTVKRHSKCQFLPMAYTREKS
jgi:hypothetical protein